MEHNRHTILMDCSGSISHADSSGARRVQALRQVLAELDGVITVQVYGMESHGLRTICLGWLIHDNIIKCIAKYLPCTIGGPGMYPGIEEDAEHGELHIITDADGAHEWENIVHKPKRDPAIIVIGKGGSMKVMSDQDGPKRAPAVGDWEAEVASLKAWVVDLEVRLNRQAVVHAKVVALYAKDETSHEQAYAARVASDLQRAKRWDRLIAGLEDYKHVAACAQALLNNRGADGFITASVIKALQTALTQVQVVPEPHDGVPCGDQMLKYTPEDLGSMDPDYYKSKDAKRQFDQECRATAEVLADGQTTTYIKSAISMLETTTGGTPEQLQEILRSALKWMPKPGPRIIEDSKRAVQHLRDQLDEYKLVAVRAQDLLNTMGSGGVETQNVTKELRTALAQVNSYVDPPPMPNSPDADRLAGKYKGAVTMVFPPKVES